MASVEDKLRKFQSVCEEKIKKIELLKKYHAEDQKVLQSFREDSAAECENTLLNLQLATVLHDSAKMRDDIRKEQDCQQDLRLRIETAKAESDEAFALLVDMSKGIPTMKARLLQRVGTLTDMATARRENYLMTLEERRTYEAMTYEVTVKNKNNQHIEWLDKLVNATRIQNQDAERRLTALHDKQGTAK